MPFTDSPPTGEVMSLHPVSCTPCLCIQQRVPHESVLSLTCSLLGSTYRTSGRLPCAHTVLHTCYLPRMLSCTCLHSRAHEPSEIACVVHVVTCTHACTAMYPCCPMHMYPSSHTCCLDRVQSRTGAVSDTCCLALSPRALVSCLAHSRSHST